MVAKYLYDAWGNCTISSETTNAIVANANPIRYRGYYYDDDTGLYYCNARYYSPKWRRFISPDDTSYLDPESVNGLNLYCYCSNDPIMFTDAQGNFCVPVGALIVAIGAAVVVGVGYTLFRHDLYQDNYSQNSAIDSNPSTSTRNQLIRNQNDAIISRFMYGKRHAWWNACETIAIHNAKVMLEIESTLSQTMLDCQKTGIMIGDGQFGSDPFGIGKVLRKYDISYSLVSRGGMTKPGVYIISYWNKNPLKNGLHTIAVHYDGNQYMAYNVSGGVVPIDPADYRWRFIIGYYLGG